VPAVIQTTHAIGRPRDDVRYAGCYLLLAPRAPEGPVRAGAADPTDEPLAIVVGLPTFDTTEGSVQVEPGVVTAPAVGSGHESIVAGRSQAGRGLALCVGPEPAPHLATEVAGCDEML